MRVLVTASARFALTADGSLWTSTPSLAYRFWTRYLDVYDQVHLLARAQPVATPPAGWQQVTGRGVSGVPAPYYLGPGQFVQQYLPLRRAAAQALAHAQAVQLRVSCAVASEVWRLLKDRPYGVEVVNDPYDVFAPGAVPHPLRPFFRWWFTQDLRRQCAGASAAAYVTEHALQRRYPVAPHHFSTHYSDADLSSEHFLAEPREIKGEGEGLMLILVGTLDQLYKAPHILIEALAHCLAAGLNLRLTIVGDGQYRPALEAQAARLGLAERVCFTGQLMGAEAVQAVLDAADLFVLPSLSEGLPRAMIEAMARGLPCIGSNVGGIPELLEPETLVPAGDVGALAHKIGQLVSDPAWRAQAARRNLTKAREYGEAVLSARRVAFYRYVREATEAWWHRRTAAVAAPAPQVPHPD